MPHRQLRSGGPVIRQAAGARVFELAGDPGRASGWTLLVDGIPQSHVDLADPEHLEFEYVRRLGHVLDLAAPPGRPLSVLHLGAGGLTLARYVAATRPGSSQLAVDSDPALAGFVRERLPLRQRGRRAAGGQAGRIRVRAGDARAVLGQLAAGSFDVIIADLFAGSCTPAHVTSAQFVMAAARVLRPAGIYAANLGDGPPLAYARGQVATVLSVFPQASLLAEAAVLRGRRFGDLVLAASRRQLPVTGLTRRAAGDPFPARLLHAAALDRFAAGASPVTDQQARPSPTPPADVFADRPGPSRAGPRRLTRRSRGRTSQAATRQRTEAQ